MDTEPLVVLGIVGRLARRPVLPGPDAAVEARRFTTTEAVRATGTAMYASPARVRDERP